MQLKNYVLGLEFVCLILIASFTNVSSIDAIESLEIGLNTGIYGASVLNDRIAFSSSQKSYEHSLPRSVFYAGLDFNIIFQEKFSINLGSRLTSLVVNNVERNALTVKNSQNQVIQVFSGQGTESIDLMTTMLDFMVIPEYRYRINETSLFSFGLGVQFTLYAGKVFRIGQAEPISETGGSGALGAVTNVGYHYNITEHVLLQSKVFFNYRIFDVLDNNSQNIIRFSYGVSIGAAYSFDMR